MIRSLRKHHLVTFFLLVVALPIVYVLTLSVRKAPVSLDELPRFYSEALPFSVRLSEQVHSSDRLQVTIRVLADQEPPTRLRLMLTMHQSIAAPDVLVYWSQAAGTPSSALPAKGHFLGPLHGTLPEQFALPAAALYDNGNLIFYSLGHQEVIASLHLNTSVSTGVGSS